MEAAPAGSPEQSRISRLHAWASARAPKLTAAATYYWLLRRHARELARAGRDERSPEELIEAADDGSVSGIDGYGLIDPRHRIGSMAPVQMRDELVAMLDRLRELRPARLCEIGASGGGTLYLLTRVAAPDAVIVSLDVDLPPHTRRARARMARPGQRIVSIEADSHDPATRDRVSDALGGEKLDFLFIDGDHSYDGVRTDFELYSGMVRGGGLIALHDINPDLGSARAGIEGPISGDVPRFWREIAPRHRTEELIAAPGQDGYGIGLIFP